MKEGTLSISFYETNNTDIKTNRDSTKTRKPQNNVSDEPRCKKFSTKYWQIEQNNV